MTADSSSYSLEALERRWQLEKTPQVGLRLAEEYRQKGDLPASIDVLATGLEAYPAHSASRVALSRYLVNGDRFEDAVPHLEQIVELDPTHLVANKLLVEAYAGIGRLADARDKLDIYEMMGEGDADIERLRALLEPVEREDPAARAKPEPEPEPEPEATEPTEAAEDPSGDERRGQPPAGTLAKMDADAEIDAAVESEAEASFDRAAEDEPFGSMWKAEGPSGYWQQVADEGIFVLEPVTSEKPEAARDEEIVASEALEALSQDAATESTVTMGKLYLEQGHRPEAVAVFQDVLTREPDNEAARQGLEAAVEVDAPAAGDSSAGSEVSTADDLERRKSALIAYREQLRRAVEAGI